MMKGIECARMKKPLPDIKNLIMGGYLSEHTGPKIRKSSFDTQLELRVSVTRWDGIGKHFYVSVQREHDSILRVNEENGKQYWWEPWDDKEGSGKSYRLDRFDSYSQVSSKIRALERYALGNNLKLVVEDSYKQWYYKEGD